LLVRILPTWAMPVPNAELSRRVEEVVACPPPCAISEDQRREFDEARLDASRSEKWQAAILKAEQARPRLRFVSRE
jgi:hypothetical protein